jgi:hypothetical protein
MAAPNTLHELAQMNEAAASAALAAARTAVQAKQSSLVAAQLAVEQAIQEQTAARSAVDAVRKQLAEAKTEADATAATVDLGRTLIALREKSAALLDAESAFAVAQKSADASAEHLQEASSLLATAKSALAEEAQAAARRTASEDALMRAPLLTLPADARKLKTTAPLNKAFRDARARIEADIPAKLIERARERRQAALARSSQLMALAKAANDSKLGLGAASETENAKFRAAQSTLTDFIANSANRVDRAKALLARVADLAQSPLTAAQKAAITAAAAKGEPAAAEEKKRDDARAKLQADEAALEEAVLKAKIGDIDKAAAIDANPASDTTLAPLVTAQATSAAALATAEAAFTALMKADLQTWESAVPDDTWALLADFEEASEILTAVANADPAAMKSARDAAEKSYVDARIAEQKAARAKRFAVAEQARLAAPLKFESENQSRRVMAALRGDQ